jgi:hypothetical protein
MKLAIIVFAFALPNAAFADTGGKTPMARDGTIIGSGATSGIGRGASPKKNKVSVPFVEPSNSQNSATR